jgi:hypothetical protein
MPDGAIRTGGFAMLVHGRSFRLRLWVPAVVAGGLLLAGAALGAGSRVSARDEEGCTNATLRGPYEFVAQGVFFAGPDGRPTSSGGTRIDAVSVGVVTFNGDGALSLRQTVSIGGHISRGIGAEANAGKVDGTYTVRPDCTGTIKSPLETDDFVIVDRGREMHSVAAGDGIVVHTDAVRQ